MLIQILFVRRATKVKVRRLFSSNKVCNVIIFAIRNQFCSISWQCTHRSIVVFCKYRFHISFKTCSYAILIEKLYIRQMIWIDIVRECCGSEDPFRVARIMYRLCHRIVGCSCIMFIYWLCVYFEHPKYYYYLDIFLNRQLYYTLQDFESNV